MRRHYLITGAAGLTAAAAIAWGRGLKAGADPGSVFMALCDGCFVVGILLVCMGVLLWVGSTGFFDMLSYGLQKLWQRMSAFARGREEQTYYDYKTSRDRRRSRAHRVPLLIGAVFLAGAVVFLLLWQNAAV